MVQKKRLTGKAEGQSAFKAPSISLPKGGGAIRGIGEKFAANPVTGTGSLTIPIPLTQGRSEFGPQLSLTYDSGSGNGPFGFGWKLSLPLITRKTDKGLPRYRDAVESDVYLLSGVDDLVPVLGSEGNRFEDDTTDPNYVIHRYRPRIEGQFIRLERWMDRQTGEIHWRSISRDNVTSVYGRNSNARIFDPSDPNPEHPTRIFSWLICESRDDKGNAIVYEYIEEDDEKVDKDLPSEYNRVRSANRYLKSVKYGNRTSHLVQPDLATAEWLFNVVFDYDQGHYEDVALDPSLSKDEQRHFVLASESAGEMWSVRPDPFSTHRSGFDIRTYRRCHRIMMFHSFPELGDDDCLVRSLEFDYDDLDYSVLPSIETELNHPGSTRFASFIQSVTQSGYVRDETRAVIERDGNRYVTYLKRCLPPLEFEYSRAKILEEVREVNADSLENLPVGLDGTEYRWIDLDGEGVSGILTEQAEAWLYKPNLGSGKFGALQTVASVPSVASLSDGSQQLLDLAGDGQLDLVTLSDPVPGFYERTLDKEWESFKPFPQLPNIRWDDPNLRFVDLNGDGHADILITDGDVIIWYPSLAEDGFDSARRSNHFSDEDGGPRQVFADGTQSIHLADMCGDGLSDIVRIRDGEVCYWPNLGYGRFGNKIVMDNSPWFDNPDRFDQARLRLADIDGSGTVDFIYLEAERVRIYFNHSGNRWSEPRDIDCFPRVDNLSSITTVDLLGNGTACLVWSSSAPAESLRRMCYIDLMGGCKPHLLTKSANNLGAETHIHYTSSTKFYLADKQSGKPWITRIPFPVHVVERVETLDLINRTMFISRYAYHHGCFDGEDREFRGFGLVEQWDAEEYAALDPIPNSPSGIPSDSSSHIPPILTRTWFHTGMYRGRDNVSDFFSGSLNGEDKGEYYREPGLTDAQAKGLLLDDTVLPGGLTVMEEREACRALKGSMLRREVYALDGTAREKHPYTVTEQNFTIRKLQQQGDNRHAVFYTHDRESIAYHYERDPSDPRIVQNLILEVDDYGNVARSATVGYGRLNADPDLSAEDQVRQEKTLITSTENLATNVIDTADDYRSPLPCESCTYELTGPIPSTGGLLFAFDEIANAGKTATLINYQQDPTPGLVQKRPIEKLRTLYRRNDLSGTLPLAQLESMALSLETYKLALTPSLVSDVFDGRVSNTMLENECKYVHSEGDSDWWIPSGRVFFSPDPDDTSVQERAYARHHFFLPHRYRDPFHSATINTETSIVYDKYDLLLQESCDAMGNRITVGERDLDTSLPLAKNGQDYRVMQPTIVMDPNRNRSAVSFDALGMVVGTVVMGKPESSPVPGDRFTPSFIADPTQVQIDQFFADPKGSMAAVLLDKASIRTVYDLTRFHRAIDPLKRLPAVAASLTRETHTSEPDPSGGLRVLTSLSYSDGFGREIQKKIQAEPGPVPIRDSEGRILVGSDGLPRMTAHDVDPRWVGTGWTVFNNKNKPVRKYEPFFTDSHDFEFDTRIGVSPVLFYDPADRVVGTLHPNHTWEKVIFGPWQQEIWDADDTVLVADPRADPDVGGFFQRLPETEFLPTWFDQRQGGALGPEEQSAAVKSSVHAETPGIAHADVLGQTFLTTAHNRYKYSDTDPSIPPFEEISHIRVIRDIEGNRRAVIDAKDRMVVHFDYDLLGNCIHQASMEAGERWMLNNAVCKPLYAWNDRDHRLRTVYDTLKRPTDSFLKKGTYDELLVGRTVYGETLSDPEDYNLRCKTHKIFDQAGVVICDEFDFKDNLMQSTRQLAQEYKSTLDWSINVPLEPESHINHSEYDALNRSIELRSPDNSIVRYSYNQANLLETVEVNLQGAMTDGHRVWTPFVIDIDYDSKGQRTVIDLGNGVRTTCSYDPLTFRLTHLLTKRKATAFPTDNPQPPATGWPGSHVQNLHYTYDAMGNTTQIRDDAQQTIYFRNRRVEPTAEYTYDSLNRLIDASGREHLGQVGGSPTAHSYNDLPRVNLPSPTDGNAVGLYTEKYIYDTVGNILSMQHRGSDPVCPGWTRSYSYTEPGLLDPGKSSNRLTSTTVGGTVEVYSVGGDGYDKHGNMQRMPHLQEILWDHKDLVRKTRRQAVDSSDSDGIQHNGEITWFVYDSTGQRVRKITESSGGQIKDDRIYLDNFEIYRKHGASPLVRESLHIGDEKRRFAIVETRTQGYDASPAQLTRFQFDNHLTSACLELDSTSEIISYEEFYPFGGAAFLLVSPSLNPNAKRYRFIGKERDRETGFYYHGARYFAPWLARWISTDPAGIESGPNAYEYARNNPLLFVDMDGRNPTPNQRRFVQIFHERERVNSATAHVETLIRAFTDSSISDRSPTVIERTMSILVLTGGRRPPNRDYLGRPTAHFHGHTIGSIGTGRGRGRTGDTGFRPELRDSLAGRQHISSSNQIGHFLTAVDIGIQAQIRQGYVDADRRFQREHPILYAFSRAGDRSGMSGVDVWAMERSLMISAMVGHELVADGTGSGSNGSTGSLIAAIWRPSGADIKNFMNGRLDLIHLNTSQRGNTYQDLLLTWVGYQFGVRVQQGTFSSNAEAARWLRMMLTDYNLASVQRSDPLFYKDAQKMRGLLQQVRRMTSGSP